ncbi:MAG: hypothetical protein LBG84_04810 [Treponema sp.]|jgi:hypothetical protein|nr:hypothetical protein [Treponema sp.]
MEKKKPKIERELEKLRDDAHLSHMVRPILDKYRMLIKLLSGLGKQGVSMEEQESVYAAIAALEKYITKFGHTFVIEGDYPFAYCMSHERYEKYLSIKKSKRYLRHILRR